MGAAEDARFVRLMTRAGMSPVDAAALRSSAANSIFGGVTEIIDPATYACDAGEGFFIESEDTPVFVDGDVATVQWDLAHPLNLTDSVAVEPYPGLAEVYTDPAEVFAWSARTVNINRPGLYIVEYHIEWNVFTSDGVGSGYSVQIELPSSDAKLYDFFPNGPAEVWGRKITWLPETALHVKIRGVDWDTATVWSNGFSLRLSPMFALDGVVPSEDL